MVNFYLTRCARVQSKSLFTGPAVSHFYGTEYDIWASFGLVLGWLAILKILDQTVKYKF